jgi:hypothetical protein
MSKMTVEFNAQVTKLLRDMAVQEDRTREEVLRRAVGLYSHLSKQVRSLQNGGDIVIVDSGTNTVRSRLKWV